MFANTWRFSNNLIQSWNLYKKSVRWTNDNFDQVFTEANGFVWTMESDSGVAIDLAANSNQASALPSAISRPPSGTYKYFLFVMNPNIKLKGSYTT